MKETMRHPTPPAPELGSHDDLEYALFLPDEEPDVGVVILHGAGSAKESHFDFARGCRADGMAALAYDARGHGRSGGRFGPSAFDDALAMAELLRAHAPRVALRGSSMGGWQAIHAAAKAKEGTATGGRAARPTSGDGAVSSDITAVVAICPAPDDGLLRFIRSGRRPEFECDVDACELWLETLDVFEAAGRLGPETALLLMHARGDEQVPYAVSERVHESARDPKRLLLMPGGHHRSVQHDEELQAISRKFIREAAKQAG